MLCPVVTLLALGPVFPDAIVNFLAPPAVFLLGVGTSVLIFRNKIMAAVNLLAFGVWATTTGIAMFTGGVHSPAVVFYPVIILMAGWLINARAATLLAVFSACAALGLWWGEAAGWLTPQITPPMAVYAVQLLLVFALSTVLIHFVRRSYRARLTELHQIQRKQADLSLALQTSEERYRTLIEWSPDAVLVHRLGKIIYVNPAALRLFGAPFAQVLLDKTTSDLIHPEARAEQTARMKSIHNHEPVAPMVESRFVRLDGSVIDVEVQGTAIDYDGEPAIHVLIRDITRRKKMENQVRHLAFYDTLTQLPNRRLLADRLSHALAASRRTGHFGAVMFLDLDNFQPLNDKHGHAIGDLLLMEAATRLKACVREMDTVARFGGDEFVVVVEELAADATESEHLAHHLAEKIRAALSEPYTLTKPNAHGQPLNVTHRCTSSIGVTMVTHRDDAPDDLIKRADAAMYQAKASGRNCIQFFSAANAVDSNAVDSNAVDSGAAASN